MDKKDANVGTALMVLTNVFVDEISQAIVKALKNTGAKLQDDDAPVVYTPAEVAKRLGVSKDLVYKDLIHRPGFPVKRIGKRIVIPAEQFRQWVNE